MDGDNPIDDAGAFYEQLDDLFNVLERKYNMPVVVAGHPHKEYSEDNFYGRRLVFNSTCELVRDAAIVILTTSTAMSFAVLYDTPVLKICNSQFKSI